MAHATSTPGLYGVMAEFDTADALVEAAGRTREAGYTRFDAYSPFPIHGLADAMGFNDDKRISRIILGGGITGALAGYGLQYWTMVIDYPMNIGGRPYHSWVSFIPPTFETTILFAAFTAGITMVVLNGLPRPYHPVFNAERFNLASQDKFFLAIEAADPRFGLEDTRAFLSSLHPRDVVVLDE
jgi:hypothetical protein